MDGGEWGGGGIGRGGVVTGVGGGPGPGWGTIGGVGAHHILSPSPGKIC